MRISEQILLSFNFFYDIRFWIFFVIIVILFRLLSFNIKARNLFFLLANFLMILALPNVTISKLALLFLISTIVFFIGIVLIKNGAIDKIRKIVASGSIVIVIGMLVFFKYSFIQEIYYEKILGIDFSVAKYLFIIGISYSSFKMIHFIVECYNHKINSFNYLVFLNYIFFFASFISGPINRYNHFSNQKYGNDKKILLNDLKSGAERIVHGFFKKFVLCTILYPYASELLQGSLQDYSLSHLLLALYANTLYFYFDFSGYSDIAIGSARIMGIQLPENFNHPFFKKNIQQLWANWHITLTKWLTDYIYWPLSKKMRKNTFFKKRPLLLSNISIITTFIVCGMWHGETFNFVVWGSYHGLGLAALNIYQRQKRKVRNKYLQNYFKSKYSEYVGVVGTFHFFVFGLMFFSLRMSEIQQLITKIF